MKKAWNQLLKCAQLCLLSLLNIAEREMFSSNAPSPIQEQLHYKCRLDSVNYQKHSSIVGVGKRPCVGGCMASSFRSRFSIYSLFRTTSGEFYNNNKDGKLWVNCRCVFKHGSVEKIDSENICSSRQAQQLLKVNWLVKASGLNHQGGLEQH